MNYLVLNSTGALELKSSTTTSDLMSISLDPYSHYGDGVELKVKFRATDPDLSLDSLKLELKFIDIATQDIIFTATGSMSLDENAINAINSVVDATEEFRDFNIKINDLTTFLAKVQLSQAFNGVNDLGRKEVSIPWNAGQIQSNVDSIFSILTELDELPTRLAFAFKNNVSVFTQLLRVIDKLNIRLFVELDPTLTIDQAISIAEDLSPFDHRVSFIWSPNLARPINSTGLKGKKTLRLVMGTLMGWHALRDARTNNAGIPPYQDPIAGFDYPFSYIGMEKRADIRFGDVERKRLAKAQISCVERRVFRTGVRFILCDVLNANGDNSAILKLINASDISMFIDNTINQIIDRHLLKGLETMIDDATKECTKFLDACTTKDRRLLVNSSEIGGYYNFKITPRADRPDDAVDVENNYHPQGAARAAYYTSTIEKKG